MKVLGINAVFHDPAAALFVDGHLVAAAEEERFSRRKHGKSPVPFSTWELPEQAAHFCLDHAGIDPSELDAVGYSYEPSLLAAPPTLEDLPGADADTGAPWEALRTLYAARAPRFLAAALPGLDPARVQHVAHHLAHAASAYALSPHPDSAVMVLDGRGEASSYLAGVSEAGAFTPLASVALPHSLGLRYEELTAHLGFRRSSDEYKVMALAAYGRPTHLDHLRHAIRTDGYGGFETEAVDWDALAPPGRGEDGLDPVHADLAASLQRRLEEVLIELAAWLHEHTGRAALALAGGVALNCVANSVLHRCSPFEHVWVQPAAGDAGTAVGAAAAVVLRGGERIAPMTTAALGPGPDDAAIEAELRRAAVAYERPVDIADATAAVLAADGLVAWVQGRSEFGPRALGHRSLLAHPGRPANLERLNDVKGREQFRPVAPMVTLERAAELFEDGPIPSPYMLFTHRVRPGWAERLPAVTHVDGTARIQTVDAADEPLVHRMLRRFEARTGLPVVVNTSLNTAGRPMVDSVRDALECFGSAPIDALAVGPFLVRRPTCAGAIR